MIVCFLLGGFNIIVSIITLNAGIIEVSNNETGILEEFYPNIIYLLISSISLITLISGVAFILAGVVIFYLLKDTETKIIKKNITDSLLTNDERLLLSLLNKRGEATQKELTLNTGLSKVKVSRVVKSLVQKGLIIKRKYGMTNKILIN